MSGTRGTRSGRSGSFGIVPRHVLDLDLSRGALRAYIALACFANRARIAWPSVGAIADMLRADRRHVQRWLRELELISSS